MIAAGKTADFRRIIAVAPGISVARCAAGSRDRQRSIRSTRTAEVVDVKEGDDKIRGLINRLG